MEFQEVVRRRGMVRTFQRQGLETEKLTRVLKTLSADRVQVSRSLLNSLSFRMKRNPGHLSRLRGDRHGLQQRRSLLLYALIPNEAQGPTGNWASNGLA